MDLLHRVRFITGNYKDLQGLMLVPFGIGFILINVCGFWLSSVIFPEGIGFTGYLLFFSSFLIIVTVVIVTMQLVLKYYHHRFGQVNLSVQPPSEERHVQADISSGWVIIGMLLYVSGMWLDLHFHPHICMSALAIAITLAIRWYQWERRPTHYLILAIIITLLSLLPAFNNAVYSQLFLHSDNQYAFIISGMIGLMLLVIGPFDHLLLLHNLKRVQDSIGDEKG